MKEVLVFADGALDTARARVQLAASLTWLSGGHLEIVRPIVLPMAPYGPTVPNSVHQAYSEAVAKEESDAHKFIQSLEGIAPPGRHFSAHAPKLHPGAVRHAAAVGGHATDLVVLGQPEALDRSSLDTDLLLGALFGGAPCLVFPRWIKVHDWGKRALIAWKSTPECARALRAALPLLKRAEKVHLIVVAPRGKAEGEDARSIERLATYVARHAIDLAAPVVIPAGDALHEADTAIASELERVNADLLVMGAYGHARLTELVFGGVTRKMINEARIPLLVAH